MLLATAVTKLTLLANMQVLAALVSLLIRDLEGGQGARLAACVSHVCAALLPLAPTDALEAAILALKPHLKEPGAHHPIVYFFKQILLRIEVAAFAVIGKKH